MNTADKERGRQLCREYLGGTWAMIGEQDFVLARVRGGLSNTLYRCSLLENVTVDEGEPRHVLLRLYSQVLLDNHTAAVYDPVVYGILAEKHVAPKLYGVFPEGRIEEYVPSRSLTTKELKNVEISQGCAGILANFHKISMPLSKEPVWLFATIQRFLEGALATSEPEDPEEASKLRKLFSYNLAKEVECLKEILGQVHSKVVFCHNDLSEGNILYIENKKVKGQGQRQWEVRPVDFEISRYNYRGFDLGNHFCEWCYDYTVDQPPYFSASLDDYPSREEQINFIRAYIQECNNSGASGCDADIEQLLLEANTYALASHVFNALWAIAQSVVASIKFGYLDYALARWDHYMVQKIRVVGLTHKTGRK